MASTYLPLNIYKQQQSPRSVCATILNAEVGINNFAPSIRGECVPVLIPTMVFDFRHTMLCFISLIHYQYGPITS